MKNKINIGNNFFRDERQIEKYRRQNDNERFVATSEKPKITYKYLEKDTLVKIQMLLSAKATSIRSLLKKAGYSSTSIEAEYHNYNNKFNDRSLTRKFRLREPYASELEKIVEMLWAEVESAKLPGAVVDRTGEFKNISGKKYIEDVMMKKETTVAHELAETKRKECNALAVELMKTQEKLQDAEKQALMWKRAKEEVEKEAATERKKQTSSKGIENWKPLSPQELEDLSKVEICDMSISQLYELSLFKNFTLEVFLVDNDTKERHPMIEQG